MRKAKSIETFEKLLKAPLRRVTRFQVDGNSSPRKVARWLRRGGGVPLVRSAEKAAAAHIHPRRKRASR